jgi:hypothetical protein
LVEGSLQMRSSKRIFNGSSRVGSNGTVEEHVLSAS